MNICQLSNATEHDADGRPVAACARALARAGHDVLLVTPAEERVRRPGQPPRFRRQWLPAPAAALARAGAGDDEQPGDGERPAPADVVHVHDPFLVGEEAVRLAEVAQAPLVFTAALRYENPFPLSAAESHHLKAFIEKLGVCYANRCDLVVASTPALAVRLFEGGVLRPIHVVPPADTPAQIEAQAARLLELYAGAIQNRRARGPVRECGQSGRLRRELALAWDKIHPAEPGLDRRARGAFSPFRDGSALPC